MSVAAPPEALAEDWLAEVGWTGAQERDLAAYRERLGLAQGRMNLVAPSSLSDFRRRHFVDSVQLLRFAPPEARVWADLGSGAGLPGLILAIALKGRPGARVHLVESIGKKARFLAETASALALPAEVHHARAEDLDLTVDVVTARACAPLERLLGYAAPFLVRGALGLFLKGETVEGEIVEARRAWRFTARLNVSFSDPRGRILAIEGARRVRA